MTIESNNGTGSITFKSACFEEQDFALMLMDWINIECIEAIQLNPPEFLIEDPTEDDYFEDIGNQLLEITDKFESFEVMPTLTLVRIPILSSGANFGRNLAEPICQGRKVSNELQFITGPISLRFLHAFLIVSFFVD